MQDNYILKDLSNNSEKDYKKYNSDIELEESSNSESEPIIESYLQPDNNDILKKDLNFKSKIKELQNIIKIKDENINNIKGELDETRTENLLLKKRLDEIDKHVSCNCNCGCKRCTCKKNKKDKSDTGSSESLVSDHDNLVNSDNLLSKLDPFKLLLKLLIIITEVKSELRRLSVSINDYQFKLNIGNHDNDDLIFYKSIILDSKKYFFTCHKIREKKIIYDLNQIAKSFNSNDSSCFLNETIYELNKSVIKSLKKSYNKLALQVKEINANHTKPKWIKNDKFKYIEDIKIEMNRTILYHIDINSYFRDSIIQEINFFKI